jgi:hypothetical protein
LIEEKDEPYLLDENKWQKMWAFLQAQERVNIRLRHASLWERSKL